MRIEHVFCAVLFRKTRGMADQITPDMLAGKMSDAQLNKKFLRAVNANISRERRDRILYR
ncbi:hypothetical protein CEQ28_016765 [Hafnia alvei]|nr:hypothetical protein CEQ28_016765 [Hafnia alvei]